jgi:Transposase, Mutator family
MAVSAAGAADAIRVKVRDQGTVCNKAIYRALSITPDGRKRILRLWIVESAGGGCGGTGAQLVRDNPWGGKYPAITPLCSAAVEARDLSLRLSAWSQARHLFQAPRQAVGNRTARRRSLCPCLIRAVIEAKVDHQETRIAAESIRTKIFFRARKDRDGSLRRGNIPDSVCYPQPKINELNQLADFWY